MAFITKEKKELAKFEKIQKRWVKYSILQDFEKCFLKNGIFEN